MEPRSEGEFMRILGTPQRYIQGVGALEEMGSVLRALGRKPMFVADAVVMNIVRPRIEEILRNDQMEGVFTEFRGECSHGEIERLVEICRTEGCDIGVGLGGGKTSDTTKGIKWRLGLPLVIAPTIASNDSPTSRVIPIYSENGQLVDVQILPINPEVVLVDTGIIAKAPFRFLAAGMGDALATKFEAEQCYQSGGLNFFKGRACQATLALADACYRMIRGHGVAAKKAIEARIVNEDVEQVVEANILLSGVGFESGGLAAAHALNHGFTLVQESLKCLHGENVAFGLLVQFVLEGRSKDFFEDIVGFYKAIGLPSTLEQIGLPHITESQMDTLVERVCRQGSYIYNMNVAVDEQKIREGIMKADELGRR
jgi:glycerol dehydrogenase